MSQSGPWGNNQQPASPFNEAPQWRQIRPGWQQPIQANEPGQQETQPPVGFPWDASDS